MPAGRPKGSKNKKRKSEPRRLHPRVEFALGATAPSEWKRTEAALGAAFHPRLYDCILAVISLIELEKTNFQALMKKASVSRLDATELEAETEASLSTEMEPHTIRGKAEARERLDRLGNLGEKIDSDEVRTRLESKRAKLKLAREIADEVGDKTFQRQCDEIIKRIERELNNGDEPARYHLRMWRAYELIRGQKQGSLPSLHEIRKHLNKAYPHPHPELGIEYYLKDDVRNALRSLGLKWKG